MRPLGNIQGNTTSSGRYLGNINKPQTQTKQKPGFLQNVATDVGEIAKGIGSLPKYLYQKATDPSNVGKHWMKPVLDVGKDFAQGTIQEYNQALGNPLTGEGDWRDAFQRAKQRAYEKPVTTALDILPVVGGAKKALGIGNVADDVGRTSRVVSKADDVGSVRGKISDYLGRKAQKFNRTNIENIKQATGKDPLVYARERGIPLASTTENVSKIDDIISQVNKQRKGITQTGKRISRLEYIDDIKKQAQFVLDQGDTPANRRVAKQLLDEAKYQSTKTGKWLTDTSLDKTKSAAFSNASKQQLSSPLSSGVEEQLGRAGVESLERVAPGSKAMGKDMRGLIAYRDEAFKQANTGKGTQLFNMFKPVGAGLITGAGAGSFFPGIGNLIGAATGATAAAIINSPKFLEFASNALRSGTKIPTPYLNLFEKVVDAGQKGNKITPTLQELQLIRLIQQPETEREQSYNPPQNLFSRNGSNKQGLFSKSKLMNIANETDISKKVDMFRNEYMPEDLYDANAVGGIITPLPNNIANEIDLIAREVGDKGIPNIEQFDRLRKIALEKTKIPKSVINKLSPQKLMAELRGLVHPTQEFNIPNLFRRK